MRWTLILVLLAGAGLLAGCGSDSSAGSDPARSRCRGSTPTATRPTSAR